MRERAAAAEAPPESRASKVGRRSYEPPEGSIPTLTVPSLEAYRRLHLMGVGGAGMSGIARLLIAMGFRVSGCDLKDTRTLDDLRRLGATIHVGHALEHLDDSDGVVVSTAIPDAAAELVAARARGYPVLARAQVLAALARERRTVAVAGTHGKTTTTSMLSVILREAGVDPSYVIGGHLNESGSGAHHGAGEVFVAEADESDGSFLLLRPEVAVITNVDDDHLDFYAGGLAEIVGAFARFAAASSLVIACGDDAGAREAVADAATPHVTFGLREDNRVRVIRWEERGVGASATIVLEDGARVDVGLRLPGAHNVLNATAAMLAARQLGVDPARAAVALEAFAGVHRRFEHRGDARGARFVDDYAHHPTELRATLAAARTSRPARLIAVFQPHRYTRTRDHWRRLGESLGDADLVVVTDVYAAGEAPVPGVSGRLLVDALRATGRTDVVYLPHRADVAPFLAGEVRAGDLVLTLGAGDITVVPDEALALIGEGA